MMRIKTASLSKLSVAIRQGRCPSMVIRTGYPSFVSLQLSPSPMSFFRRIVFGDWLCAAQRQHHADVSMHQRPTIFRR
jgi:hypothetical protein